MQFFLLKSIPNPFLSIISSVVTKFTVLSNNVNADKIHHYVRKQMCMVEENTIIVSNYVQTDKIHRNLCINRYDCPTNVLPYKRLSIFCQKFEICL